MTRPKRWYEHDEELSFVVNTLERLGPGVQGLFENPLLVMTEEFWLKRGGQEYLALVDDQTKDGVMKSQKKARWYDATEKMHRAFNILYILPEEDRHEIALRLLQPMEAIEGYEQYCQVNEQDLDVKVVEGLLKACFTDGEKVGPSSFIRFV